MTELGLWLGRRRLLTSALSAGVGAFGLTLMSLVTGWRYRWVMVIVLALLVAYGSAIAYARTRAAERDAKALRSEAVRAVNAGFRPLVTAVGEVIAATSSTERERLLEKAKAAALDVARDVVGPKETTRSCLFELVPSDRGGVELAPIDHRGRAREPRTRFHSGSPRGDEAINSVLFDDEPRLVVDTANDEWLAGDPTTRSYRGYAAAGISCVAQPFGMLTVDTEEADQLEQYDLDLLRVIASILGIAYQAAAEQIPGSGETSTP